jgi:hypothetical protein
VEREDETSPAVERHADEAVSIDSKATILLPADPAHWTEEVRNRVYADLAQRSIRDFADLVKVVLYSLDAQKEDDGIAAPVSSGCNLMICGGRSPSAFTSLLLQAKGRKQGRGARSYDEGARNDRPAKS